MRMFSFTHPRRRHLISVRITDIFRKMCKQTKIRFQTKDIRMRKVQGKGKLLLLWLARDAWVRLDPETLA